MDVTAAAPAPLSFGDRVAWFLRNLVILLFAFFPSALTLGTTVDCMLRPPDKRCVFAPGMVLYAWIILVIPAAVVGAVHLLAVLSQALRRPWLARGLAAALLPGLALALGGAAWARAYPAGMPVLAVCGVLYAAMLRLNPRQRLGEAMWVWAVPPGLLLLLVVLMLAK